MNQKKLFSVNKTLTAVLLCLLMFTVTVFGSDESDRQPRKGDLVITYDFETGNMTTNITRKGRYLYEVKKGHNVTFKVINFNRSAYTAVIDGEAIDNFTSTPGAFQSYLETKQEQTSNESVTDLKKIIGKLSAIKTLPEKLRDILHVSRNFCHLSDQKANLYSQIQQSLGLSAHLSDTGLLSECKNTLSNAKKILQEKKKDPNKPIPLRECREIITLEGLVKEFKEKKYIEEIEKTLSRFDEQNFSVSLTIPTVDADEVEFTVKFEPIDKKKTTVQHLIKGPVKVTVKGGWKLDFSTGFFFNLNAHDHTYRFDDDSSGNNKVILRENKPEDTTINPVIGAMLHVYPRQSKRFLGIKWLKGVKWSGVSFGLSGSEAENLSYYLGTGLMFGAKKRLVINAGGVLTKFKDLLPRYRDMVNQSMDKNADLKPEDMTESVYKLRFFIGLTYNLGKNKKL